VTPGEQRSSDFTIVVPLFGHPRYFAGREAILPYQSNVLVALEVTRAHMQTFAQELEAEGWRVCRIRMHAPNPATLMKVALRSVRTTYALRLDADTSIDEGLERVIAAVAMSNADTARSRLKPSARSNAVAKLQALEYRIAMLSRHYRPWMTSGACFIGKTKSLRLIFAHHSLWTPGEDIETGRTAHALKLKIRHADFVVRTEVRTRGRASSSSAASGGRARSVIRS